MPEGSLIGGVVRAGKIVAAVGDAVLQTGDRVIVFAPTASETEVRKILYG
jgi:Trk K+ transport system NAD-binding subunit